MNSCVFNLFLLCSCVDREAHVSMQNNVKTYMSEKCMLLTWWQDVCSTSQVCQSYVKPPKIWEFQHWNG